MATNLEPGSISSEFIIKIHGTGFLNELVESGGIFPAIENTNILIFPGTNDVGTGGDDNHSQR